MIGLASVRDVLTQRRCLEPRAFPELFGPTAINAQTSNQRLAVALDGDGTVTVCRWPRPSFYDQLKFRSRSREEPRMGAYENEGSFLGLRIETANGEETVWFRDCPARQGHEAGFSDVVVTSYDIERYDLVVTVEDVVATDEDALLRDVTVERGPDSPVEDAWLVGFANLALVTSKRPRTPTLDWCRDDRRVDTARYRPDADAVVYSDHGVDQSTDELRRVAMGLATDSESAGHQVGGDAHEPNTPAPAVTDAYDDASDGPLSGVDKHTGHTTAAISTALSFEDDRASETVYLLGAEREQDIRDALARLREREPADIRAAKTEWLAELLSDAPLPNVDDEAVLALARRALVTLVTNFDPESGAVVASIATQYPYAQDWPRDGAFFNHALHLLGLGTWAEQRARWYASLQAGAGEDQPGQLDIPEGNWSMNYYADGVVGGPVPYEIDQTGYAVWMLWDHYRMTGDESYLEDVYPAIRRAAEFFVDHRDPETGLHALAFEDDNVFQCQTVVGAAPVWRGLAAAAAAARELGEDADAVRYEARQRELGAAIERHLWDEGEGAYTGGSRLVRFLERLQAVPWLGDAVRMSPLVPNTVAQPAILWPVRFHEPGDPRMASHVEHVWEHITETFAEPEQGDRKSGMYETLGLIALARAWRDDPDRFPAVQRGVEWVAHEHATDDTYIMGEMWMNRNGGVVTAVSQPHCWAQVLFYYASLEAFPPDAFTEADGVSVVAWLRERQRPDRAAEQPQSVREQQ